MQDQERIKGRINSLRDHLLQAALLAGSTVRAVQDTRIFVEGEASNNQKIGRYSTTATYVGRGSFLTQKGAQRVLGSKSKRSKLYGAANAAGRASFVPKKTDRGGGKGAIYFPGGYKGIREADGRQTVYVDLRYSGKLRNSYQTEITARGFNLGFTNRQDALKMFGNEKRFNKQITKLSQRERQVLREAWEFELSRRI